MRDSTWRVGVIGTGFIGPVHVEALRRLGIEVVALAGNNSERTAEKARQLRIAESYGSVDEMLERSNIDVVHITSPNHLHFPHAKAALLAGKHVVCEKPLAMDSQESRELVRLAKERKLVNAVNFMIRYYPLSMQARALVQQGELGDIFIVQGTYLQDWLLLPTDWNWRLEPEFSGKTRAIADIGSHWLDLTTFITGLKVEAVLADFGTFLRTRHKPTRPVETFTNKELASLEYVEQPIHTEDYAGVLLRYSNGARGALTVSQVSAGRKNRMSYEIDGSRSAIAWDGEHPNELWIGHRDRPNELLIKDPSLLSPEARQYAFYPGGHAEGFPDTFKSLYHSIYRYLDAGDFAAAPDFPTFEDGHEELLIGEAIWQSAHEDRWISVNEAET
ncbi:MAG: Gfo/Idh/MocA family oxidoreductase [Chloroflexota bacterium]|nr:Gfo/Idh/MocA family oxidoreductase [Chloroflexota bacterium]